MLTPEEVRRLPENELKQQVEVIFGSTADGKTRLKLIDAARAQLTKEEQKEAAGQFPQDSGDRMVVYVVGFLCATVVLLALTYLAVEASRDDLGMADALLVAATGFTSLIIGGSSEHTTIVLFAGSFCL